MEEDELEDIYGGLEYNIKNPTAHELSDELSEVKKRLESVESELQESKKREAELTQQNALLKKKSDLLLKNISCLYNTAKQELEAKKKEIDKQKEEIETLRKGERPGYKGEAREKNDKGPHSRLHQPHTDGRNERRPPASDQRYRESEDKEGRQGSYHHAERKPDNHGHSGSNRYRTSNDPRNRI